MKTGFCKTIKSAHIIAFFWLQNHEVHRKGFSQQSGVENFIILYVRFPLKAIGNEQHQFYKAVR